MKHFKPPLQDQPIPTTPYLHTATAMVLGGALLATTGARAEQPPPPCHANPQAAADVATVRNRGDVAQLPDVLSDALQRLADPPHTYLPMQVYAEADKPSQLFQYYLLDTNGFEPNVFTTTIPGVNDSAMLTATGAELRPADDRRRCASCSSPSPACRPIPNDVAAFIDVFTDISGLFVINNESGWYEGWMIHDLRVADGRAAARGRPRAVRHHHRSADADAAAAMGNRQQRRRARSSRSTAARALPERDDHFPDRQTNVVPIQLSMGATTACSRRDATRTGSSTTRPTGFIRCTSCRSRAASRTRSSGSRRRLSSIGPGSAAARS